MITIDHMVFIPGTYNYTNTCLTIDLSMIHQVNPIILNFPGTHRSIRHIRTHLQFIPPSLVFSLLTSYLMIGTLMTCRQTH
jgi:hypothetical protein